MKFLKPYLSETFKQNKLSFNLCFIQSLEEVKETFDSPSNHSWDDLKNVGKFLGQIQASWESNQMFWAPHTTI